MNAHSFPALLKEMTGLSTLRGQLSLQDALDEDDDVLAQLRYPEQQKKYWGLAGSPQG